MSLSPPPSNHDEPDNPEEVAELRAEIERLKAQVKSEFDIATGYHSRWQDAEARLAKVVEVLQRFKREVWEIVMSGGYPSPSACGARLGRPGLRSLSGREIRWRREMLARLGWKERKRPHRKRFSWTSPKEEPR